MSPDPTSEPMPYDEFARMPASAPFLFRALLGAFTVLRWLTTRRLPAWPAKGPTMPDIPAEALEAAARVLWRHYDSQYKPPSLTWRHFVDDATEVLSAAAPFFDAVAHPRVVHTLPEALSDGFPRAAWPAYREWVRAGDRSTRGVWPLVKAAFAAGRGQARRDIQSEIDNWVIEEVPGGCGDFECLDGCAVMRDPPDDARVAEEGTTR